jgi:predicted transcriptional regulator
MDWGSIAGMIRRSKLEVFVDIMRVVSEEGEIRRTRVMYRANLAWKVLKAALDTLEAKGILKSEQRPTGVFVSLTDDGYKVLRRFDDFESVFAPSIGGGPSIVASARTPALY